MTQADFMAEFRRVSRLATDANVSSATAVAAIEAFGKLDHPQEALDAAVLALRQSMDWRHERHVDEHGSP